MTTSVESDELADAVLRLGQSCRDELHDLVGDAARDVQDLSLLDAHVLIALTVVEHEHQGGRREGFQQGSALHGMSPL